MDGKTTLLITVNNSSMRRYREDSVYARHLRSEFPKVRFCFMDSNAITSEHIRHANIIVGHPDPKLLIEATQLQWLHVMSAGVDAYARPSLYCRRDVIVTRAIHVHDIPVAEHALGLVLACMRMIPSAVRLGPASWNDSSYPSRELAGSSVLLLGAGELAVEIALRLRAFSAHVSTVCLHPDRERVGFEHIYPSSAMKTALSNSDIVINTLPLTPLTHRILDKEAFDAMKPNAVFVNVGRGACVDQSALISALNSGHLSMAALDVADPEPLPVDCPLWRMDNVLITPHVAGYSDAAEQRKFKGLQTQLRAFLEGRLLSGRVDLHEGY